MRDYDIKFVNKEITPFGGLSLFLKMLENLCHYIVNGKRIIGKTNIERLFIFLTQFNNGNFPKTDSLFKNY